MKLFGGGPYKADYEYEAYELHAVFAEALVQSVGLPEGCSDFIQGPLEAGEAWLALEETAHFIEYYGAKVDPTLFRQMEDAQRRYLDETLQGAIETVRPYVTPAT